MNKEVLVCEISGKRPGNGDKRKTEQFRIDYPKCIISNNSEGYETDWEIVNVPDNYRKWYEENIKISDKGWQAPMNRSYAIKYAKEHGYKYLIQLDDNIVYLLINYSFEKNGVIKKYKSGNVGENKKLGIMNDFIDMLITVLKNTNAGMAGCNMEGVTAPDKYFLSERFCYSLFALDLSICPEIFQGGFEDDIEYRLKLAQMGIPSIQVCCMNYMKTSQKNDSSGNRKAYQEVGIDRGKQMLKLYGDVYKCGLRSRNQSVTSKIEVGTKQFKHILRPVKVGIVFYDKKAIENKMKILLEKWANKRNDKVIIKTVKKKPKSK